MATWRRTAGWVHRIATDRKSGTALPLKETDLIFAHPDGSPLAPGTIAHNFSWLLEKAGIPHIRFHDLRHTHAILLLVAGVNPKVVSERLGHSST